MALFRMVLFRKVLFHKFLFRKVLSRMALSRKVLFHMALYRMVQSMEVFPSVVGPLVREVQRMVVYRIPLAQDRRMVVFPSVVEVGMDVPNATLIVIENADRFGLSQLHQLRGRVGRGKDKSYCILFSSNRSPETQARLKALCSTNDGFKIAEEDLAMRGPGDLFGSRQHGLPAFKVGNLAVDLPTLKTAQQAAEEFLANPDYALAPEYQSLLTRVRALFAAESDIFN